MTAGTRVDCHVKVLDERVVERAKRRGLDVLVYAPHFTRWPDARARAEQFSDDDLLVVPGRELFTGSWRDRRHVLALDLESALPDFCTLGGTMAELERQQAVVLAPHPTFANVSLGRAELEQYRELVDAAEIFNPKHLPWDNRRARHLVGDLDIPPFTSSYAHLRGTVGEAWTTFEDDIETEPDLLEALRTGAPRRVERRRGPAHVGRRTLEFGHLFWENSWQKVDRILLSGTDATHPGHVAYEGRFDDIRVY